MHALLRQKLRTQVNYASWQLGLGILYIILWGFTEARNINIVVILIGLAQLTLWILGIINAIKIHELTGDAVILIVFSIFVLLFAHLIAAMYQKSKFEGYKPMMYNSVNIHRTTNNTVEEQHLKNAFTNGVITADEYEKKLKKLREKKKKQPDDQ